MRVPVLVLPLLLLAGCGIAPFRSQHMSSSAVVLQTPVVEQDEMYDCGLAAISALCGYYRVEIPESQRAELAQLARRHEGLSGTELREALERLGMEVYLFEGRIDKGGQAVECAGLGLRLATSGGIGPAGAAVAVAVRPERIALSATMPKLANRLQGTVREVAYRGEASTYHVAVADGRLIRVTVPNAVAGSSTRLGPAASVWLGWDAESCVLLTS